MMAPMCITFHCKNNIGQLMTDTGKEKTAAAGKITLCLSLSLSLSLSTGWLMAFKEI